MSDALARAAALPCWSGPVTPRPLDGGITNTNFVVDDGDRRHVVRIGADIPEHGVMRFNELAASRAAHAAGVSPAVVHAEPGALVLDFIDGRTLTPGDLRDRAMIDRVVPLLRRVHQAIPRHLEGAVLAFWVFQVLRDYQRRLRGGACRRAAELDRLAAAAEALEGAVGPVTLVFGHNDLLAANLIDDGTRLWLVDWDYAGLNSPLFDLSNLATNNGLDDATARYLLETYDGAPAHGARWRAFRAMGCASLLRETMWSMVSEIHSTLDYDYATYTDDNLARFDAAWDTFCTEHR